MNRPSPNVKENKQFSKVYNSLNFESEKEITVPEPKIDA
jgi:hypothetical protein